MKTIKHITYWLRQAWNNIMGSKRQLLPPGAAKPIVEDYETFFFNYINERS